MKLTSVIDRAGEIVSAFPDVRPVETALDRAAPARGVDGTRAADGIQDVNDGRSRRSFLRNTAAVLAAGAAASAAMRPGTASAQSSTSLDAVHFADIRRHENDHVLRLNIILGDQARPKPTFQNLTMPDFRTFLEVSQAFENVGCAAYTGAAPYILNPQVTALTGPIALIEGRHAGFLNTRRAGRITQDVFGAEQSFETALNSDYVLFLIGRFVANLNGGEVPYFDTSGRYLENDVRILNYALALEYLEAEFYNINVPAFFG